MMKDQTFDFETFEGFPGIRKPRYTQTPDVLFDKVMPHLKESELKVLLYIFRHTFGYGKEIDEITIKQLMGGVVSTTGEHIDYGTGLTRETITKATASLEEKGLIVVERRRDKQHRQMINRYKVRFAEEAESEIPAPENSDPQETTVVQETNNENGRQAANAAPSPSQSINNDKHQLIADIRTEFAPQDNEQAIQTYLGRFPIGLITRAAEITRQSADAKNKIAYCYGTLQKLQAEESYLPAAQQQVGTFSELTPEEYAASLQALERVKRQVGGGDRS